MKGTLSAFVSVVLCGCSHSTQCYNISNDEAVATANRQLDQLLKRSSPAIGIPAKAASELSISKIERLNGDKGSGHFNVTITFTKPGKPGQLLAFVYEDCVVGWSPQFEERVAPEQAR
jgi:hypothetical protein